APSISPTAPTPQAPLPVISTAPTPQVPIAAAQRRPTGPKAQPPGLHTRPGVQVVDVVPPGIRPPPRPATNPGDQPIPASELVRRPPAAPSPAAQPSKFSLAALAGTQRGQRVRLSQSCQIGRSRGQILFAEDPFLSPLHASLTVRDGRLFIKDENSASGTFVSVPGQEQIQQNAHFSAGLRLFRFMGLLNPRQGGRAGAGFISGARSRPGTWCTGWRRSCWATAAAGRWSPAAR